MESNIHYPTDATLLQDGIRVITRLLLDGYQLIPKPAYHFSDHNRVVKRRVLRIKNAKSTKERQKAYQDLLRIAEEVRGYALGAITALEIYPSEGEQIRFVANLLEELKRAIGLLERIRDQTRRRVIYGEKVPASEKVVSLFEDHTDIIEKGQREIVYGHKVFLGRGKIGFDFGLSDGQRQSGRYRSVYSSVGKTGTEVWKATSSDGCGWRFRLLGQSESCQAHGSQRCFFLQEKGAFGFGDGQKPLGVPEA